MPRKKVVWAVIRASRLPPLESYPPPINPPPSVGESPYDSTTDLLPRVTPLSRRTPQGRVWRSNVRLLRWTPSCWSTPSLVTRTWVTGRVMWHTHKVHRASWLVPESRDASCDTHTKFTEPRDSYLSHGTRHVTHTQSTLSLVTRTWVTGRVMWHTQKVHRASWLVPESRDASCDTHTQSTLSLVTRTWITGCVTWLASRKRNGRTSPYVHLRQPKTVYLNPTRTLPLQSNPKPNQ